MKGLWRSTDGFNYQSISNSFVAWSIMQRVSSAQMQAYRRTAKRRQAERDAAAMRRLQTARGVAQRAADWLKETYSVGAVWLFGSLAENFDIDDSQMGKQTFTLTSDIDLAVGKLPPGEYFMAIALLQDMSEFKIDLVQLESIPASFKAAILEEGKLL